MTTQQALPTTFLKHLPVSDNTMGEPAQHYEVVLWLYLIFQSYFARESQIAIHANLLYFYDSSNVHKYRVPDLMIIKDCKKDPLRKSWQCWAEGNKHPCFVIELRFNEVAFEERLIFC